MGGRGDSPKALPQRPLTPPIEKWDCEFKEEEAAAAAAKASQEDSEQTQEEEEENWDTAFDDLSWENMQTPPTDYSNVPSLEEEEEGLAAAEASLPT